MFCVSTPDSDRNSTNLNYSYALADIRNIAVSVVYFSESINEYAAQNWKTFSKQQYFDGNGLFISTVFSIPILLNCMLLIVSWANVYVSFAHLFDL